jgi:hypothetical protein
MYVFMLRWNEKSISAYINSGRSAKWMWKVEYKNAVFADHAKVTMRFQIEY